MNPVAVTREVHNDKGPLWKEVLTYCPGCRARHSFRVELYQPDHKRSDDSDYPTWTWNGDLEKPTFQPSLLCHGSVHLCEGEHTYTYCDREFSECGHPGHGYVWEGPNGEQQVFKIYEAPPEGWVRHSYGGAEASPHPKDPAWGDCHSYLTDGVWNFLGDSAHPLAGQHVPLEPLPEWIYRP